MHTRTNLIYTLCALILSSCAPTTTVQPIPTVTVAAAATQIADGASDAAVAIATLHKRWEEAGIRNYRFSLMVGCFCPMAAIMPITIEVRDGNVVSMRDGNDASVTADDPTMSFFRTYTTIDGIYAELTSTRFADADKLTITFDPTYPVPATVNADFIEMAADDELFLGVSGFTVVAQQ